LQAIKNNNSDRLTPQRAPVAHAFDRLDSPLGKRTLYRKDRSFDYIGLEENSLEEKGLAFLAKANQEVIDNKTPYWIEDNIENFLKHHKERLKKGEILANTWKLSCSKAKAKAIQLLKKSIFKNPH
jgi:hypothetical protein